MATLQEQLAKAQQGRARARAHGRMPTGYLNRIETIKSKMAEQTTADRVKKQLEDARNYAGTIPSVYQSGALGRVNETITPEQQNLLSLLQSRATGGFNSPEMTQLREGGLREVNQSFLTAEDRLRRMQGGAVRAASASAQLQNLLRQRIQASQNLETDMFNKQLQERANNTAQYATVLGSTLQDQLSRQMYNLGQQGAELAGRVGEQLGYQNQYQSALGGTQSQDAANQALEAEKKRQQDYQKMVEETMNNYKKQMDETIQKLLASFPLGAGEILLEQQKAAGGY